MTHRGIEARVFDRISKRHTTLIYADGFEQNLPRIEQLEERMLRLDRRCRRIYGISLINNDY
jgi:hypothetical protein